MASYNPLLWTKWTTDDNGHTQHDPPLEGDIVLNKLRMCIGKKEFELPSLRINVSEHGVTVLANQEIHKDKWVTQYLGRILTRAESNSADAKSTHFKAISKDSDVIDSSCDDLFPLGWYIRLHALGGFIDDPWFEHKQEINCEYESFSSDHMPAYKIENYPYQDTVIYNAIMIKATKHIAAGERLFIDYGNAYHERYKFLRLVPAV